MNGWFGLCPAWLVEVDKRCMLAVNPGLYNPVLSWIVRWLADDVFLACILLAGLAWVWTRPGGEGALAKRALLASLVLIVVINLLDGFLLKPAFARPRPWMELQSLRPMVFYKPRSSSFPSTHTAVAVSVAWVFGACLPRTRLTMAALAGCIAFFCVYTGGHYPLDVLAGGVLGVMLGWLAAKWSTLRSGAAAK